MKKYTRESLIEAVRKLAKQNGGTVSKIEFFTRMHIGVCRLVTIFKGGGWLTLLKAAGIKPSRFYHEHISDEKLITAFHKVAVKVKKVPTWDQFKFLSGFSELIPQRRFGGIRGMLQQYLLYLKKHHPDSPLIDNVKKHLIKLTSPYDSHSPFSEKENNQPFDEKYGSKNLLNFRGLERAPENEECVIYLFGIVSRELGFIVRTIRRNFPDCIAKRRICVSGQREEWRNVRIEFEFKSKNFKRHNHDPRLCDLIICWKHNWPSCPIEVIELKSILEHLPK